MMNTRLQNRLTESEILKIFSDVVEVRLSFLLSPINLLTPDFYRPSPTCTTNLLPSSTATSKSRTSFSPLHKRTSSATLARRPSPSRGRRFRRAWRGCRRSNLRSTRRRRCSIGRRSWWMFGGGKGLTRRLVRCALSVSFPLPRVEQGLIHGTRHRTDIWALGVFLYKLCFYTTPFEEHGPLAILNAQYKVRLTSLSSLVSRSSSSHAVPAVSRLLEQYPLPHRFDAA